MTSSGSAPRSLATRSVAALVINWNGAHDTLELLSSLRKCQCERLSITAVVVDNASAPDDVAALRAGILALNGQVNVVLQENKLNVGVPAAYNQAIQVAGLTHDYYLRLDNDVVVEPRGLLAMVETLERRAADGVAIVGGNIKYFDNQSDDNGGAVTIDLMSGTTSVAYPSTDVLCDGVLGCIMLVSGTLVRDFAPEVFESALFVCTDESELSMRAAKRGCRTLYLAQLIGFHKGGRSTTTVKSVANYYSARNWTLHRLRYVSNRRQRLAVLLVRIPFDGLRNILRGRWAAVPGLVAGLGLAVAWHLDTHARRGRC